MNPNIDSSKMMTGKGFSPVKTVNEKPDFNGYFSPLSPGYRQVLYTEEVLGIIFKNILDREVYAISNIVRDTVLEGSDIKPAIVCDEKIAGNSNGLKRSRELVSKIAFHIQDKFVKESYLHWPYTCKSFIVKACAREDGSLPNVCVIVVNRENLYAKSVLDKSEASRVFEGVYEFNLNMIETLDRVAKPGLAMLADFFCFANDPPVFETKISAITDPGVKTDAEKLGAIVRGHMEDAAIAKNVIEASDKLGEYIALI
ncbi:MAG: hypothetical protein LBC41_05810 [Clostridiales bacterium]|jgi:hypothetical protein|nr:hypothetical protein [Clostridiales bacterium]